MGPCAYVEGLEGKMRPLAFVCVCVLAVVSIFDCRGGKCGPLLRLQFY